IVIQGIACRCSDRRLVLTTQDNLSLDILSPAQQRTLNTLIRQELAQLRYQRRRQWALTQQQWRGIPLISGKSPQVIAPLDWLWQGIYRWQTRPEAPGQLIPVTVPSLPPLPQIQDWVGQTTTTLAHHPIIEATVVKSQRVSAQIIDAIPLSAFPPALQHLGEDLRQKLAQGMATSENAPDLSSDPFALKVLIQAAIAHFFGPSSSPSLATPGQDSPALTDGDRDSPSPWLQWEDLFAELPQPPLSQPLLSTATAHRNVSLSEIAWTEETINATDHWHGSAQPVSPITPEQALVRASSQALKVHQSTTAAMTANPVQGQTLSAATVADPWDEVWVESPSPFSPSPRKLSSTKAMAVAAQTQALETAFDWIETSAKTLGYDKHILVWCLEWLDRLVYWLEVALGRIWHWLKHWLKLKEGTALQRK
ncbi:MAG: hypothetical protein RLZZ490_772, partial [Cyanobacteriota bacterium]